MRKILHRIYRSLFLVPVNNPRAVIALTSPWSLLKGRSQDKAIKAANEIGYLSCAFDVSKCDDFTHFIAHCAETPGPLDTLMINAGFSLHEGDILNVTPQQFDSQIATNLRGAYFAAQAF